MAWPSKERTRKEYGPRQAKTSSKMRPIHDIVGWWAEPDRSNVPIVVLESEPAIELEVACETLLLIVFLILSSSPSSLPSSPSSSAKRIYDPALNPKVPCFASTLKRKGAVHGGNRPSKIIHHAAHLGKRGAARRIKEALGACSLTLF